MNFIGVIMTKLFIGSSSMATLVTVFGVVAVAICIRKRRQTKNAQIKNKTPKARKRRAPRRRFQTYDTTVLETTTGNAGRRDYASMIADPYAYNDLWLPGDVFLAPKRDVSQSYDDVRIPLKNQPDWLDTCSEPGGRALPTQSPIRIEEDKDDLDQMYLKVIGSVDLEIQAKQRQSLSDDMRPRPCYLKMIQAEDPLRDDDLRRRFNYADSTEAGFGPIHLEMPAFKSDSPDRDQNRRKYSFVESNNGMGDAMNEYLDEAMNTWV